MASNYLYVRAGGATPFLSKAEQRRTWALQGLQANQKKVGAVL